MDVKKRPIIYLKILREISGEIFEGLSKGSPAEKSQRRTSEETASEVSEKILVVQTMF